MYLKKNWRKQAYIQRNCFDDSQTARFDRQLYRQWISMLPHVRAFVDHDSAQTNGIPSSRLIPQAAATKLFDQLQGYNQPYTLLLNDIETVDHNLLPLREHLNIPYQWRIDDIVATFSAIGSGIGYHAGHEDAVIFQASGKRHWQVWHGNEIDFSLRKRILINQADDRYRFAPPQQPPVIDCILNQGDVLYIPAFFPHKGVTLEQSISIAFGWKGICYFHMAQAFNPEFLEKFNSIAAMPNSLFELIADYDTDNRQGSIGAVIADITTRISDSNTSASQIKVIQTAISSLFS